jgi:hypothetical protein
MTSRLVAMLLAITIAVIGTACTSGSNSQGSSTGSTFLRKPNPVTVTEHLDTSHSATAIIDSAGGALSVKGGDGVKFTLTIPADGLPLSHLIRMTPVASVDGLPWQGGLLAAVHIQPDGTVLAKPATLAIDGVKSAPSGSRVTGFMYEGTGADFHLYPLDSTNSVQFHLIHFSSPGVGGASQQDITTQLDRAPTTPIQQLEQNIAGEIFKLGQGAPPAQVAAAVQKLLNDFEKQVLISELDRAIRSGSFEQLSQAFADLNAWKSLADFYGLEAKDFKNLLDRLYAEFPKLLKAQINACFEKHDVLAGIRAANVLRLLGLTGPTQFGSEQDAIFRCLRFKLDFDTQLHSQDSSNFTITSHVATKGVRPISIEGGGSAPLNYISFEWATAADSAAAAAGCAKSSKTMVTEDFRVIGMQGLELEDQAGKKSQLTDFFVNLKHGNAVETLTESCAGGGLSYTRSSEGHYYKNNWETLHRDEHVERASGSYFAISGWSIHNGNILFAEKMYSRTDHYASVTVTELTEFNLYHDPEGSGIS